MLKTVSRLSESLVDLVRSHLAESATLILIIVGSLTWSLTMVKSGLPIAKEFGEGVGFWGANGHDGIWHLALIESLAKQLPSGIGCGFSMPVFAGEQLKNYHIGFDLLVVLINKLTNLPINLLYFQILPPIFALAIGFLTYKFVSLWRGSRLDSHQARQARLDSTSSARRANLQALIAVFFVYFGGSFGWLVSLFRGQGLGGESMFWSQQAISTLINPPFALSLIICLIGLLCLTKYLENHATCYLLPATVFFGFLIEIKVYAGILVLAGLLVAGLFRLARDKKFDLILVLVGSSIVSLILYFPNLKNSPGLLVFQPLWFLETMLGLSDRVGWPKFFSAMTTYRMGGVWLKMIPAYLIAFVIFVVGNMGTRILGIVPLFHCSIAKENKKNESSGIIGIFTTTIIVAGITIPMLFLQKGTPWNTIQFFYYSLFFSGILAGITVSNLISRLNTNMIYIMLVAIVVFTIPTTIGTLKDVYLPARPPAMLLNSELEALNFLKKQPDGIVLTYPFDKYLAKEAETNPPRPLYLYESTAYVAAFSGRTVFLEDEVNLDITGYPWPERRQKVLDFSNTLDQSQARKFLKDNNISYIYWVKPQRARLGEGQLGLTRIFENNQVDIYRTQ